MGHGLQSRMAICITSIAVSASDRRVHGSALQIPFPAPVACVEVKQLDGKEGHPQSAASAWLSVSVPGGNGVFRVVWPIGRARAWLGRRISPKALMFQGPFAHLDTEEFL